MVYSGYIVRSQPERWAELLEALRSIPDLSLGPARDFAVPVAAASADGPEALRLNERLASLPGALSATLVYHRFDDFSEQN